MRNVVGRIVADCIRGVPAKLVLVIYTHHYKPNFVPRVVVKKIGCYATVYTEDHTTNMIKTIKILNMKELTATK